MYGTLFLSVLQFSEIYNFSETKKFVGLGINNLDERLPVCEQAKNLVRFFAAVTVVYIKPRWFACVAFA